MRLISIHVAPERRMPLVEVDSIRAVPGRGLEGDRYFHERGSYSKWPSAGREVTLIASETLRRLEDDFGIRLGPGEHRRSLVTEGVELELLVGRDFTVGEVLLRGDRPCDPCRYLDSVATAGTYEALRKLGGGLRAVVLTEGIIRVGDGINVLEGPVRGGLP